MNLHILPDEKIVSRTISIFEMVFPNENKYVILLSNGLKSRYVEENSNLQIGILKYGTKGFWDYIGDTSCYDSIIIHYLSEESASFVNSITHPNIYWIEWGGDLYNTFLFKRGFRLYRDEKLIARMKYPYLPFVLYSKISAYLRERKEAKFHQAVYKIKYFLPDSMYDEYPLFLNYYKEFNHLIYKKFFYYPIDIILGEDLIDKRVNGFSVIVGNSCSFTNNHLYIFDLLKMEGVGNEIIAPLSYSGNQCYRKYLTRKGYDFFEDKFTPLINYVSLSDYNKILLRANSFIYGNLRQEAVGNILIAFFIGGKIFLDEQNPLYDFYKSIGLHFYSLSEISKDNLNTSLDSCYVDINRKILYNLYSSEVLLKTIRASFSNE